MKAVVHTRYGSPDDVLAVREIATPPIGDDDVLVRVRAASIHPDVWHVVIGIPYVLRLMGNGVRAPKHQVPGSDLAGVIEAIGRNVTRFSIGDEVFGECAMAWRNGGAFAERTAVREDRLALKPANVTFEQAASVGTSGFIALTNLRPERIGPGHAILINGAGGNVGSLALQIARARGAHVTAVDHTRRLPLLRSLGADRVLDYTTDNVLQRPERYDLVFDVASTLSLDACADILTPAGRYTVIGHARFSTAHGRVLGDIPRMLGLVVRASVGHPHLPKPDFNIPGRREVMETLRQLMASGTITPVVARTFPLGGVPDAIRCMQDGFVAGRIVITP